MPPDSWLHGLESVRCTPGHKAGSASVPSASRLAFAGPLAVVHLHLSLISQVVCNYSQAVRRNPKISSVGITIAFNRGNDWSAYSKENGSGNSVFRFTAPGATLFPQYIGDVFLAFTSASCRFLKGDTGIVTTRATVHNQRDELVLDGEHTYSLKAASADEVTIGSEAWRAPSRSR